MKAGISLLEKEFNFLSERIILIRRGDVRIDRGIDLKTALLRKKEIEDCLKLLKNNL